MKTKNIITLVVSILILAVLAFGVWWLVKNKDAVFGYVNDTNIYTQDEYDKHYQEGYDQGYQDANNNEDYYKKLLAQYESQLAEKNASLEEYQKQQEKLLAEKNDLQSQLDTANSELEAVQPTIDALEQEIAENEATMLELESEKAELEQSLSAKTQELENVNALLTQANADIEYLEAQIDSLEGINSEYAEEIRELTDKLNLIEIQKAQLENDKTLLTNNLNSVKTQLEDTQALYENLQLVNSSNMTTITNLNNRIITLNTQISELTYQLQNTSSSTTALNDKIADLQASIEYYKSYIASLENGSQVVATYEYDGSVINIQLVAPGSKLSINAPEDTIYITLNGWQIDGVGEYVDFDTFVISENTYFVANLTYKFDVKFMSNTETEYDSQLIVKDNYATKPTTDPVREGYVFKGWSKDGVTIVEDINSTAVTEHTTYYAVWSELHTVTYMEGSDTLTTIEVENGACSTPPKTTDTAYKKYNGWLINGVSADPTTYKIVADTIFVADITYSYDVIFMNGDIKHDSQIVEENLYPNLPTAPVKEGYDFLGWSLNQVDVVNVNTTAITAHTTYYAVFETKSYTVTFKVGDKVVGRPQNIGYNKFAEAPEAPTKIDSTFIGWSLTENGSTLDISSYPITGDTVFYAIFTRDFSFEQVSFGGTIGNVANAYSFVWTDGNNVYFTSNDNSFILNEEDLSWKYITLGTTTSKDIWTVGQDIYMSSNSTHYKFNKEVLKWERIYWNGLTSFYGDNIWTDGENTYYSSNTSQYVLNIETSTWETKTWQGLTSFYGTSTWTDGENTYYSSNTSQYVLNKETSSWEIKTWNGVTSFSGNMLYNVTGNIYFINGKFYTYKELASSLIPYCKKMGYTHIELLPITEYPFDISWGYQVTGYFAATSRFGKPKDLMYFVDKCHEAGLGVILDWVPAHFETDDFGLKDFDGKSLYESYKWDRKEQLAWGTRIFDYEKPYVTQFLISSALFFLRNFHFDGIRVDAVVAILYLDFARSADEWIPNSSGGNVNFAGVEFLKKLNNTIFSEFPNALMIAEEVSGWPMTTKPTTMGGLGFNFKWNVGWINDIWEYTSMDPYFRKYHHLAME